VAEKRDSLQCGFGDRVEVIDTQRKLRRAKNRIADAHRDNPKRFLGIRGVAVAGGRPVVVNANGQLGIMASSARFKEAIKLMDKASEAILSLQTVTFRYKKELDPGGVP
jgi:hypothetical protein